MMNTTFTVFISIESIEKQTEDLVLRKFFLNEKAAKKYYCDLQKMITEKGYIYSFSDKVHHFHAGLFIQYAAYYDSEMENDLTLQYERASCNIDFDEKHDKVTLYDDAWGDNIATPIRVFSGIEAAKKAIFEDGELTFDHFTKPNKRG